jgi:hypothetical protein
MATRTLTEKIEALPPEKKAEVEDFVEFLARRAGEPAGTGASTTKTFPDEILERIGRRRERLFQEHGYFDTLPILRDLRENGPR